MRKLLLYGFVNIYLIINSAAQPNQALNRFVSESILKNAGLSVLISETSSDKPIVSYAATTNLTPASTLKLITTATALEMFGPEFCFETEVAYSGKIVDGVLEGDLYIIGHGDPTLGSSQSQQSSAFFDTILSELKKVGVTQIIGRIIGDESNYNSQIVPPRTTWEDMGNYYAAGISALNYGDNSYKLTFKTGVPGTVPRILRVEPQVRWLEFHNFLQTKANDKDSAYVYGMPYEFNRYLYGSVPANSESFTIKGDVPDPAMFLVDELNAYLINKGLKIKNAPLTSRIINGDGDRNYNESLPKLTQNRTKLFVFRSDKLSHIIRVTNKKSYNLYAEALLRLISSKFSVDASLPAGIAALKSFWSNRKLNTNYLMYDGSGLSPANKVNAKFFVDLLRYMSKSKNSEIYFNSFAVAGVDGTLKSFMSNSPFVGKVFAKSGSFEGVLSYCGQIEKNNRKYNFCIIANGFTCQASDVKRAIERLLTNF